MSSAWGWLGLALVWLAPVTAWAHPDIDRGRALLTEADFDGARAAFAAAERATRLTRSDVVALAEGRALLAKAEQRPADVDRQLTILASIDPDHTFADEVPPDLRARFAELRGRVGVLQASVTPSSTSTGVTLALTIENDPGSLVRQTRLFVRAPGAEWRSFDARRVEVPLGAGQAVDYYVELVGPGNAPLASAGSAEAPLHALRTTGVVAATDPAPAPARGPAQEDEGGGDDTALIIGLIVGAGVILVGGIIGLTVWSQTTGPGHQLGFPEVMR